MSSKSKEKAEETKDALGNVGTNDVGSGVTKCKVKKHWIGIKVKDSDGKVCNTVPPTLDVDGSVAAVTLDKKGKYDSGKVLISAADANISFPDLFDCDWWPDGSAAPTPTADRDLTVTGGDCVVSVAAAEGFRSYHDIWDAAANNVLKTHRPNPNSLVFDDKLKAPSKKEKKVAKAVDKEWTFIVRAVKKPKLRLLLVDKELKATQGLKWALSGVATQNGTTGADGLAELAELDPTSKSGTLKVTLPPRPAPKKAPAAVAAAPANPPPYPAPIKPAEFKDTDPVKPAAATEIEFDLKIGRLPSHKHKRGVMARLHNLGFKSDLTSNDDALIRAVKGFQRTILGQNAPSGAYNDVQDELETRHSHA
jgi:hypothetical protein